MKISSICFCFLEKAVQLQYDIDVQIYKNSQSYGTRLVKNQKYDNNY